MKNFLTCALILSSLFFAESARNKAQLQAKQATQQAATQAVVARGSREEALVDLAASPEHQALAEQRARRSGLNPVYYDSRTGGASAASSPASSQPYAGGGRGATKRISDLEKQLEEMLILNAKLEAEKDGVQLDRLMHHDLLQLPLYTTEKYLKPLQAYLTANKGLMDAYLKQAKKVVNDLLVFDTTGKPLSVRAAIDRPKQEIRDVLNTLPIDQAILSDDIAVIQIIAYAQTLAAHGPAGSKADYGHIIEILGNNKERINKYLNIKKFILTQKEIAFGLRNKSRLIDENFQALEGVISSFVNLKMLANQHRIRLGQTIITRIFDSLIQKGPVLMVQTELDKPDRMYQKPPMDLLEKSRVFGQMGLPEKPVVDAWHLQYISLSKEKQKFETSFNQIKNITVLSMGLLERLIVEFNELRRDASAKPQLMQDNVIKSLVDTNYERVRRKHFQYTLLYNSAKDVALPLLNKTQLTQDDSQKLKFALTFIQIYRLQFMLQAISNVYPLMSSHQKARSRSPSPPRSRSPSPPPRPRPGTPAPAPPPPPPGPPPSL